MRSVLRKGYVLPLVLLTMLIVALLASGLQAAVWRATRHARLGFAGERALHGADAAVAQQLANWNPREFASMTLGARKSMPFNLAAGLDGVVTLVRTAPDAAIVEAIATSSRNGALQNATRRVTRAVVVRSPALPVERPVTTLGPAIFAAGSSVSAIDEVPPDWLTECAGLPLVSATKPPRRSVTESRTMFDANWSRWLALASRRDDAIALTLVEPIVTGTRCTPGTGDPFRTAGSVAACVNEWGARAIANANPARLAGANRHQGVLMIDGDLEITGDLEVSGLLIVRGAIDASAGRLSVHGAALIRDDLGHGSRFGIATRVRYSRCALRRALSAVGAPAAITTRGWLERF